MKRISILLFAILLSNSLFSQSGNSDSNQTKKVVYTFFFNAVPDPFHIPMIGFVNIANGDFRSLQMGYVNTTFNDFRGAQFGFINTTFNNHYGLQWGFINTTFNKSHKLQAGFINTASATQGGQIGFINTTKRDLNGAQIGFVNSIVGRLNEPDNTTDNALTGTQIGYVNTTLGNVKGSQIGFVNVTKGRVKGSQIGFVNYADTVTGVPLGFVSVVKKGGYRAVEVSANEFYPVNLSFKIGIPKLYTFIQVGYNPDFKKQFASGGGIGSLLPIGKSLYFNPEANCLLKSGL
jgi:hypothetical protein